MQAEVVEAGVQVTEQALAVPQVLVVVAMVDKVLLVEMELLPLVVAVARVAIMVVTLPVAVVVVVL